MHYLICNDFQIARHYAESRGWQPLSFMRFAADDKTEIRLIRRYAELLLFPNGTYLIKAPDFDENPDADKFEQLAETVARWSHLCEQC